MAGTAEDQEPPADVGVAVLAHRGEGMLDETARRAATQERPFSTPRGMPDPAEVARILRRLQAMREARGCRAAKPRATNAAVSSVPERHKVVPPSPRGAAIGATGPEAKALAEVKAFVKKGGDLNGDYRRGLTALHWAARHGYVEVTAIAAILRSHGGKQ